MKTTGKSSFSKKNKDRRRYSLKNDQTIRVEKEIFLDTRSHGKRVRQ
jgi:hypothetical protein